MTDSVYRERAHLVALLASMYPSGLDHDPAEPEYVVMIVELPTGQVSWHIAPEDTDLFPHVRGLPRKAWDGHTTEEKYERVDAYTRANARSMGHG